MRLVPPALLLVGALASSPAFATSVRPVTLEELASRADDVVRATVLRRRTSLEAGRLFTHTTLRVDESLKGDHRAGEELVVRQVGGARGTVRAAIPGDASFVAGEAVVVLLRHGARVHYLTSLALSKMRVTVRAGRPILLRDVSGLSFAPGGPAPAALVEPEALERALHPERAR